MLRTEGEASDVVDGLVIIDDENIMFPVATSTRLSLWDGHHGLHGQHHARLKHRVNVLTQLQSCSE